MATIRDKVDRETDFSQSEQPGKLQLIADTLPVLVSYIDRDERYQFNNKNYEEWFSIPRQKMYRQRVQQVIGDKAYKRIRPYIRQALRGKSVNFEDWLVYKNGDQRYVTISYVPDRDSRGKVVGFVSLVSDVTGRKQAEEGQRYLTRASEVLSSSLDYETTLRQVAHLAVPNLADWCGIDMMAEDGRLARLEVAHKDPKKVKWAHSLQKKYPTDPNASTGVPNVARTGVSELYSHISDDMVAHAAKDAAHLKIIRKIGMTSVMIVPIMARRKVLGVISFVSAELGRHYHQGDLQLAEELARHAGLAIENARLYQAAHRHRERLDSIMASIPGIVWEAWGRPDAATQRIDFVSDYVERMLGYTVQEWEKTPNFWLKIVHPEDKARAAAEATAIFRSGRAGQSQFRWITKSGRTIWVEAHSIAVKDKKGQAIGMRGVNINITPLKELEQRKDEFISMASHELKTPVTTLKLFTQILQRQAGGAPEDRTSSQYLDKMNLQLDKLSKLISDLLDISKMQANRLKLTHETFDINMLTREVVDAMQHTTATHKLIIQGKVTRAVRGDRDRISQVLTNLLSNAIKYSPRADKVVVRLSQAAGSYKIAVRDFGIGISKAQQQKIFTRFYRVYEGDEKTYPGLGIGLYLSQEIAQRHGGTITAQSSLGKGSTFLATLPFSGHYSRRSGVGDSGDKPVIRH